jgi:hypothetical protein
MATWTGLRVYISQCEPQISVGFGHAGQLWMIYDKAQQR